MRYLILLLLACLPALGHAHGTELLGGRLETGEGGDVVLSLDISPVRLSFFAGMPPADFRTWGDVRGRADAITACFSASLTLRVDGKEMPPARAEIRPLTGQYAPSDVMNLPDFIPVTVVWKHVTSSHVQVVTHFDLPTRNFILTLEDATGQSIGLADYGAALVDPTASAGVSSVTPTAITTAAPAAAPMIPTASVEPWWKTLSRALFIGIEHIVPDGLDHILFVAGLYLASRRFRDLLLQVTAFTVAHCLTLGLVMGGILVLGPIWARAVEIGIALSIVAVTVENCIHRDSPGWRRICLVGTFGLIHGLGFAGALAEVKWPDGRFFPALVAANVGIEIGQFLVIGSMALLTVWWWHQEWYRWRVVIPASLIIGLCGLNWAIQRTMAALS